MQIGLQESLRMSSNLLQVHKLELKHFNKKLITWSLSLGVRDEISKRRLEAPVDAVFAIVMTLLVLEITMPQLSHSEASTELTKELVQLWPVFLSYATSFIILGFSWIGHIDRFHFIKRVNRTFLWVTILYLMLIALIPFSTALLGEYGEQQVSVIVYGINLFIIASWVNVNWWYATKNRLLIDGDSDPSIIRAISRRYLLLLSCIWLQLRCLLQAYRLVSFCI